MEEHNNTITVQTERFFWNRHFIKYLILIPSVCSLCGYTSISLTDNNSINNPIVGRCCNSKCRKIFYLRENIFFAHFPRTPCSIIYKVLKLWFIEKKNAIEIYFKEDYKNLI
jgi:hypothetical protein